MYYISYFPKNYTTRPSLIMDLRPCKSLDLASNAIISDVSRILFGGGGGGSNYFWKWGVRGMFPQENVKKWCNFGAFLEFILLNICKEIYNYVLYKNKRLYYCAYLRAFKHTPQIFC